MYQVQFLWTHDHFILKHSLHNYLSWLILFFFFPYVKVPDHDTVLAAQPRVSAKLLHHPGKNQVLHTGTDLWYPWNASYPKPLALVPKTSEESWQTDLITFPIVVVLLAQLLFSFGFSSIHPHSPIFSPTKMRLYCSCASGCFQLSACSVANCPSFCDGKVFQISFKVHILTLPNVAWKPQLNWYGVGVGGMRWHGEFTIW